MFHVLWSSHAVPRSSSLTLPHQMPLWKGKQRQEARDDDGVLLPLNYIGSSAFDASVFHLSPHVFDLKHHSVQVLLIAPPSWIIETEPERPSRHRLSRSGASVDFISKKYYLKSSLWFHTVVSVDRLRIMFKLSPLRFKPKYFCHKD